MRTFMLYTDFQTFPELYIFDEDLSNLDNVVVNCGPEGVDDADPASIALLEQHQGFCDQLTDLMYDADGHQRHKPVPLTRLFELTEGEDVIIQCGFAP